MLNMLTVRGKEQITPYRQTLLTTRYSHKAKKDHLVQSNPSKNTWQDPPNQTMKHVDECEAKFIPTVLSVLFNEKAFKLAVTRK